MATNTNMPMPQPYSEMMARDGRRMDRPERDMEREGRRERGFEYDSSSPRRDPYNRDYMREMQAKGSKNKFHDEKSYRQYSDPHEVFQCLNDHALVGVAFHDEMMDLFGFLGLYGFKKMHHYQYASEVIERRQMKCYVLDHLNRLLSDDDVDPEMMKQAEVIPDSWYEYSRKDVTPQVRKQYVEKAFEEYKQWEEETKDLLSYCCSELMYMGRVADFNEVSEMLEDVEDELRRLETVCIKLKSVDYDLNSIINMQKDIEDEYEGHLRKLLEEQVEKNSPSGRIGKEKFKEKRKKEKEYERIW